MVVGALELTWPVGGQTADGGLVLLLADLWGDAMHAKSEKSTTGLASKVPVPVQAGSAVSVAGVDVAVVAKDLEDDGSDSDSTAVSSASSKPGEPPAAAGSAPAAPAEARGLWPGQWESGQGYKGVCPGPRGRHHKHD